MRLVKKKKLKVTADCTTNHFSLTDEACLGYNTLAKVNPPLRSADHVAAIKKGLKDGTIEVITTDHAPHRISDKNVEFTEAAFGISGVETLLPLVITNLVGKRVLKLEDAIAKITCNPAKILGLENKGHLKVGADADITIFDPKKVQKVESSEFESLGKNTPFEGLKLSGWPTEVIVGGELRMAERSLV